MGSFAEQLHPRGTGATGGQFVAKGNSGANDTVGYDAKTGSGAGYGTKGGDARVKRLQQVLNNMGFTDAQGRPLKVDGKLGPKTTAAIKRLQRKLGLKADGLVTPGLLRHIQHVAHQAHVKHVHNVHTKHKQHQAHVAHKQHVSATPQKKAAPVKRAPARNAPPRKAAR